MQTSVDKLREHYSDEKTNNEESNKKELYSDIQFSIFIELLC